MTVNAEEFFGFTDWSFGGKIGENAGYAGKGSGKSGAWDISSVVQSAWDDVMLIFKSGNGTTLTGYMLKDGVTSGTWNSPFAKDVSHISVYYRDVPENNPPERVPEPGLMTGLLVAGAAVIAQRDGPPVLPPRENHLFGRCNCRSAAVFRPMFVPARAIARTSDSGSVGRMRSARAGGVRAL